MELGIEQRFICAVTFRATINNGGVSVLCLLAAPRCYAVYGAQHYSRYSTALEKEPIALLVQVVLGSIIQF